MEIENAMSTFIRSITALITGALEPKLAPCDEFTMTFMALPQEADLQFVDHAQFLRYAEIARWKLASRTGILTTLLRRKCLPIVGSQMIRYQKSVRRFETIAIRTAMVSWDARWMYFRHRFENKTGCKAVALAKLALRSPKGVIPPQDVLAEIGHREPPPALPFAFVRWIEAEQFMVNEI